MTSSDWRCVSTNRPTSFSGYSSWPPALLYNSAHLGAVASTLCIVKNFNISKSDRAMNRKTRELVAKLIRAAADNGWSEYRAAPALQPEPATPQ